MKIKIYWITNEIITTMNYYETIRAIRNKMFPPKLEFGCEVINVNIGNKLTVLDGDVFGGKVLHWNWNINEARVLKTENLKILGLPVSLNDILLMIENKNLSPLADNQNVLLVNKAGSGEQYVKLDLTLPIKDQTPKVLKKLWEIIK